MNTRNTLAAAICVVLSACGGGSNDATPTAAPHTADAAPYVFIGDSITYHWFDPYYTPKDQLMSTLLPGAVNAGVPGQDSHQMLARFDADVLSQHPRTVHILAGTNDVYHVSLGILPEDADT